MPIVSNKKTVAFGDIEIFFSANVGILLTNKIATNIVKYGVNCLIFNSKI